MKDAEFIELLNLYVDQEISVADAARLEAEVQRNPERRRTYQQYCRMQKACKLLTQDFQTTAAPAADRKVVAFDSAARRTASPSRVVAAAALAAAACLAFIFANRDRTVGETSPAVAAHDIPAEVRAPAAIARPDATRGIVHAVSVPPAQPAIVGNPLLLSGRANADAILAAAAEQAKGQFEWMRTVQFSPLQRTPLEMLRFEAPVVQPDGSRTFSSPQATQGPVEWVGFQFNK